MPATVSPVGLIETHFGNLRDPRALHIILHKLATRYIGNQDLCGNLWI
jgi:hypothetical protein